jgi:signal transduction histidine kinase
VIRRLRRLDRRWLDRAIATVILVAGMIELFARVGSPGPQSVVIMAIGYSTLFWRRSRPVVAGAVMFAMWILFNVAGDDVKSIQMPLMAALFAGYAMGAYTDGREAKIAPFVILVGVTGVTSTWEDQVFTDFIFPTAFVLIAWLAGRGVRTRTRLTEELHEAAVQAQEAHEEEVARAAVDERRRIAREMHDVVAHSVSVMVVQAGGARRILDRDPARAIDAAAHIEEVGRAAMAEMRRLLGVLHHSDERAPQPGMARLGALVERTRAAGLPVSLSVEGEQRSLPAGKDLAAYRVVQEALTNVTRHAGDATASVDITYAPDTLTVKVEDDGEGAGPSSVPGYGLIGMRERVTALGGRLRAEPGSGGGFSVVAELPVTEAR